MKFQLAMIALCFLTGSLFAQEKSKMPASTEAAFTQQFGGSEIQVAYARPLVRGRKIFGGLVPFDSIWRTGAGDCTTIKLKEETTIGDKKIAAGKYALFSIPTSDEWTIILNSDTTLHGTKGYDVQKDVYRFKAKSMKTDRFYETFTIEINDINAKGEGFLNLIWENTIVKIPLNKQFDVAAAMPTPVASTMPVANTVTTKTEKPATQDMSSMNNMEKSGAADLKTQFAPVLSAYFGLKDALVSDNGKVAAKNGKALYTALQNLDTKTWTIKQRNAYEDVAKKLETDAEHIGDNADKIDHQREHFESLSLNLIPLMKALKINTETTYVQYCPMKKAYWLSTDKDIKNPYFGSQMLTCGSVTQTLK